MSVQTSLMLPDPGVKLGKGDKPTCVDLFAGAGGFSLGVQQGGYDVVAAVETDKNCCATLRANRERHFPRMEIIQEDIRSVTGDGILKRVGIEPGDLDLVIGGPPCQGFSTVNAKRSLDDPRSKLMHEFVRLVGEMMPRTFVFENVPGILDFKGFMELIMESLEVHGYIVRCLMMDAASYGVPQRRRRIICQGQRVDLRQLPIYAPPTHFAPEALELPSKDAMFTQAQIALAIFEMFLKNGHPKEDVHDLYWNEKLGIQMRRSNAGFQVEAAIGYLVGRGIQEADVTNDDFSLNNQNEDETGDEYEDECAIDCTGELRGNRGCAGI